MCRARVARSRLRWAAPLILAWFVWSIVGAMPSAAQIEPPVYAYYYIWFDPTSWDRAKTDYPILGRYSSDLDAVMRRHITWAKQAGIDGFIVSWKSTDVLDPRLETLTRIAEEERFELALIYQGLDFYRNPQPVGRIANDLRYFRDTFASSPAFQAFGRPLVIWSGTWEFDREQIRRVAEPLREDLTILASERSVEGYDRVAPFVGGNAYYWSSVDPSTYPGYPAKLAAMASAVHERGGLWIPPASPGYDARLVGGTTVVDRGAGATLRATFEGAMASDPDVVGLISWNEFSENTHVEPSERFGHRYLGVLADLLSAQIPADAGFDSSEPQGAPAGPERLLLLAAYVVGAGALVTVAALRRR